MRIAYDHQIFSDQCYGGISRYFCNLSSHLSSFSQIDLAIIAPLYVNSYLKSALPTYVMGLPTPSIPKGRRISCEISSLLSPIMMNSFRPDIVHETYYSDKATSPKHAAHVVTVHDMLHEKYPSFFSDAYKVTAAKRISIDRADFVICVSEHTRQDLINLLDVPEEKTITVHHGYDLSKVQSKYTHYPVGYNSQEKPYLLYVGQRRGYKNFLNLLRAYSSSSWLISNINLICFGGGKFDPEEKRLITDLGLSQEQIIQVSGDDNELAKAYQGASAFVYPSLYEGFGIPLLEAMSFNCPVVCSKTSAIPEVVGQAGEYFDPEIPEDIAAAIERVLNSTAKCNELVELGRRRYIQFSWEKCARETLAVYQKIS